MKTHAKILPIYFCLILVSCQRAVLLQPPWGWGPDPAECWNICLYICPSFDENIHSDTLEALASNPGPYVRAEVFEVASKGLDSGLYSWDGLQWLSLEATSFVNHDNQAGADAELFHAWLNRSLKPEFQNLLVIVSLNSGDSAVLDERSGAGISWADLTVAVDGVCETSGVNLTMLSLDSSWSASIEYLFELSSSLGVSGEQTFCLSSPGPWPTHGRNYEQLFDRLQQEPTMDTSQLAQALHQALSSANELVPGEVFLDIAALEGLYASSTSFFQSVSSVLGSVSDPATAATLRDHLFASTPAYYFCPGLLRIGFLSFIEHCKTSLGYGGIIASANELQEAVGAAVVSQFGGDDVQPTLLLVPLFASGEADSRFPLWYRSSDMSTLRFLRQGRWAPTHDNNGTVLDVLWH